MNGWVAALLLLVVTVVIAVVCYFALKAIKAEEARQVRKEKVTRVVRSPDGKKLNLNTKVLENFLNQADDYYIQAFQRSNVEYFLPYCTVSLAMSLNNRIIYCNDKVFGLKEHRKRSWRIVAINEDSIVVRKDITFDTIKDRGKRGYITYADPIHEHWTIGVNPSRFQVLEVKDAA
jgi:hypothetical protein